MSFADSLVRLRNALVDPHRGRDSTVVRRDDLHDLLFHFDRLDREARAAYELARPTPLNSPSFVGAPNAQGSHNRKD